MAAHEDNIAEKHERNIKLYEKIVTLIKEIKPKIDKIFNNNLRKYILEKTKNTEDFDNYKEMFNELVKNLPANRENWTIILENTYNLDDDDDNHWNFNLLDITLERTIIQIEQIILAFQSICKKGFQSICKKGFQSICENDNLVFVNNLVFANNYLSKIIDDIEQVKSIRTPEAGKIKKKEIKKKKNKKQKKKTKKNKKRKQKKTKKENKKRKQKEK